MSEETDGPAGTQAQQAAAKAVARGFREKVKTLVDSSGDRSLLFEALRTYQQVMNVEQLVAALSTVLNHPDRLPLFHDIRLMIPPRQHLTYNSIVPPPPSNSLRVVTLKRHGKEGFGFSVRGGKEYNCGLYISSVRPGSAASTAELRIGEQLLSIDGYPVSELIHEEVLNMLRGARTLRLRLKAVCMLPYQNDDDDTIHWQLVGADGNPHTTKGAQEGTEDDAEDAQPALTTLSPGERRVTITKDGKSLGCGIVGGSQSRKGIFVTAVQGGGLACNIGLQDNDQITSVNGVSFIDIKHADAVRVLKSCNVLVLTVKSEKDLQQQEKWEQEMEQMKENRLLEFAQARPDTEGRTFYISPPINTSPLEAEATAPNPYAEAAAGTGDEEDDELGNIDLYSTEDISSDDDSEDDDDEKEKDTAGSAATSVVGTSMDEDDIATTNVVQSHLQRMYIEQMRERKNRMNKSNVQRQNLLQEVRGLRKTPKPDEPTTESKDPDMQKREDKTPEKEIKPAATEESRAAAASAARSSRMIAEEAVYEEAKIVVMSSSYLSEKGGSLVRSAVSSKSANVNVATNLTETEMTTTAETQAPAAPPGFSDDPEGENAPDLPPRNTAMPPPMVPRYSTIDMNKKRADRKRRQEQETDKEDTEKTSSTDATSSKPDDIQQDAAATIPKQDPVEAPKAKPREESSKRASALPVKANTLPPASVASSKRNNKVVPTDETRKTDSAMNKEQEQSATPIPAPRASGTLPALPKSQVSAGSVQHTPAVTDKPVPSPRPTVLDKPVPSPKPVKKVQISNEVDKPTKTTTFSAATVAGTIDQQRHSPPPPGVVVPKASALKTSPSTDTSPTHGKVKPRMKKQASFAIDVECVVIKPPTSKHHSMSLDELDEVNPSNLEFGEDVLQGRRAVFHSIPKDGPLGIKLKGGVGTTTGGRIFIAGVNADGAVGQYGKIHAGDQILMVDGTSFVEINQKEATQALHEAMQWDTECIDIVVATEYADQ